MPAPSTAILKKSLFDILGSSLQNSIFVDLFAGTGSVGFEAASRGACKLIFVDKDAALVRNLRDNIQHFQISAKALAFKADYKTALRKLTEYQERINFIFIDPPYLFYEDQSFLNNLLFKICENKLLHAQGKILVQRHSRMPQILMPQLCEKLQLQRSKKFGISLLEIFQINSSMPPSASS